MRTGTTGKTALKQIQEKETQPGTGGRQNGTLKDIEAPCSGTRDRAGYYATGKMITGHEGFPERIYITWKN